MIVNNANTYAHVSTHTGETYLRRTGVMSCEERCQERVVWADCYLRLADRG